MFRGPADERYQIHHALPVGFAHCRPLLNSREISARSVAESELRHPLGRHISAIGAATESLPYKIIFTWNAEVIDLASNSPLWPWIQGDQIALGPQDNPVELGNPSGIGLSQGQRIARGPTRVMISIEVTTDNNAYQDEYLYTVAQYAHAVGVRDGSSVVDVEDRC